MPGKLNTLQDSLSAIVVRQWLGFNWWCGIMNRQYQTCMLIFKRNLLDIVGVEANAFNGISKQASDCLRMHRMKNHRTHKIFASYHRI